MSFDAASLSVREAAALAAAHAHPSRLPPQEPAVDRIRLWRLKKRLPPRFDVRRPNQRRLA